MLYSLFRLEQTGICQTIVSSYRTVVRYRDIPVIGWRYELRCKPCLTFRWFSIFYISVGDCCTTECVPFTDYREEPYYRLSKSLAQPMYMNNQSQVSVVLNIHAVRVFKILAV